MKKINVLYLSVLLLFTTGCASWFDDELPKHQIPASVAISDQASAETALLGVYSYLGEYGTFSAYYLADDPYRCGLLEGTNRGEDFEKRLELLSIPAESTELLKKWEMCGQMINAANHLLYGIEKVADSRFIGNRKKEIIAETRFLRAFAQLYLMKHFAFFWDKNSEFGPLMRRTPGTLANNNMERAGVGEAYDMILDDLNYAIDNAPDYKSPYIVSKGLAKGFKVETLLLRGNTDDYSKIPEMADEVINNYGFKLESSFEEVFKNGYKSSEMMFSRYLSSSKLTDVDSNVPSIKKLMCGKFKPNDQFFSMFNEENDARYKHTFDSTLYESINSNNKILILKKLWRADGNCPMFYMRLAQMYLFKAEALAHMNAPVEEIIAPINELRSRSGNTEYEADDFQNTDDLLKMIFMENLREIGFENGSEWFVAVRLRLSDGKRLVGEYNSVYQDDKQLAWQIPVKETTYNTLMKPNPEFIR